MPSLFSKDGAADRAPQRFQMVYSFFFFFSLTLFPTIILGSSPVPAPTIQTPAGTSASDKSASLEKELKTYQEKLKDRTDLTVVFIQTPRKAAESFLFIAPTNFVGLHKNPSPCRKNGFLLARNFFHTSRNFLLAIGSAVQPVKKFNKWWTW